MALEMRAGCERRRAAVAADGATFIRSSECAFCGSCREALERICPNCGGELVPRPRRKAPE
jgi:uncharacterized protein